MTTVLVTLLAVVVALLVVLVAGLLRSHAEILRALQHRGVDLGPEATKGRPRGPHGSRPAVDIAGRTPDGDSLSIAIVGASQPTMLVFLTSSCTTCADFWNAFADVGRVRLPGGVRLVLVTKGEGAESSARLRRLAPSRIAVVMSTEAWDTYDVAVAPYFAYVDGESSAVVAEGPAEAWDDVVSSCAAQARLS